MPSRLRKKNLRMQFWVSSPWAGVEGLIGTLFGHSRIPRTGSLVVVPSYIEDGSKDNNLRRFLGKTVWALGNGLRVATYFT